jgi:hypothetical protein
LGDKVNSLESLGSHVSHDDSFIILS